MSSNLTAQKTESGVSRMKKVLAIALVILYIPLFSALAGEADFICGWKDDLFWLNDLRLVFAAPQDAQIIVRKRAEIESGKREIYYAVENEALNLPDGGELLSV